MDAQFELDAGDDGTFTFGDTVWVVKVDTRLAVDGAFVGSTKPSDPDPPFAFGPRASAAALSAFRRGSVGMISLALEDGSQRELAIDLAGFSRAMDTAKRFFADANRGYKAHSCKSVTD